MERRGSGEFLRQTQGGVELGGEGLHLAQRLLEVVGGDRGELLELGVGARELRGMAQQLVGALQPGVARRQRQLPVCAP